MYYSSLPRCTIGNVILLFHLSMTKCSGVIDPTSAPKAYNNVSGDLCCNMKCPICPAGEEPNRTCGVSIQGETKPKCIPCAQGFYKKEAGSLPCRICSKCMKHQEVEKHCTSTQDQLCGKCINGSLMSTDGIDCIVCCYCFRGRTKRKRDCNSVEDCPEMCTDTTAAPQQSVGVFPRYTSRPHRSSTATTTPTTTSGTGNQPSSLRDCPEICTDTTTAPPQSVGVTPRCTSKLPSDATATTTPTPKSRNLTPNILPIVLVSSLAFVVFVTFCVILYFCKNGPEKLMTFLVKIRRCCESFTRRICRSGGGDQSVVHSASSSSSSSSFESWVD